MPSSVVIFRNEYVSHPPSAWKSSSLTIFIRCLVFGVFGPFAALTRRTKLCHGLRTTPTAARSSVGMRYLQRGLRGILPALALLLLAPCAPAQPSSVAEIGPTRAPTVSSG